MDEKDRLTTERVQASRESEREPEPEWCPCCGAPIELNDKGECICCNRILRREAA